MKVLVIPDIHLKPWILDKAEEQAIIHKPDAFVFIGDLVDDWKKEYNLELYDETFNRLIDFIKRHDNFYFCYGNHDISYKWKAEETGYSSLARPVVMRGLDRLKEVLPLGRMAFIYKIDSCLFSHAGLVDSYVRYLFNDLYDDTDALLKAINKGDRDKLWNDLSPIWVRPQYEPYTLYKDYLQVTGHTPVEKTGLHRGVVSVDSFSTFSNGEPIGDEQFVIIDTVTKKWFTVK